MNSIFKFKNEKQGLNIEEFRVSVTSVEGFWTISRISVQSTK